MTASAESKRISVAVAGCGEFGRNHARVYRQMESAELLGVSRRTIYNRIRDGRLQTIRTPGGSQRVLLDSVQVVRGPVAPERPGRPSF